MQNIARAGTRALLICAPLAVFTPCGAVSVEQNCLDEGNARRKLDFCTKAIAAVSADTPKPDMARLYVERAVAETVLGKTDFAVEDANRAVSLAPTDAKVQLFAGETLMHLGKYERALLALSKAADARDDTEISGWALYLKAICYAMIGRADEAGTQLASARAVLPARQADYEKEKKIYEGLKTRQDKARKLESFEKAKKELAAGKLDRAAALFSDALASNPAFTELNSWLGSVYFDQGDYARALQYLLLVPEAERWNYYIAVSQLNLSMYDKALAAFRLSLNDSFDKNRGEDHKAESIKTAAQLAGYFEGLKAGDDAAAKGDAAAAAAAYETARGFFDTPELQARLDKAATVPADKKNSAKNGGKGGSSFVLKLALAVFGLMLGLFLVVKLKAAAARGKVRRWENFVGRALSLPYRESYALYAEYKEKNPAGAARLAKRISEYMAESCDLELVQAFAEEVEPDDRNRFLISAAAMFITSGGTSNCVEALAVLNRMPFDQWDDGAVFMFVNAHVLSDDVLFQHPPGELAEIWAPGIAAEAYFLLARIYARRGNYAFALSVMERLPSFSWTDAHWVLYLRCMFALGAIGRVEIERVPDAYKAIVAEQLFKAGLFKRITKFLNNLPRDRWQPEYYFYSFFISLSGRFEDSWPYYASFSELFPVGKANRIHYMFALLCEHVGKFDKARAIYDSFASARRNYKDMARRAELIRAKRVAQLSPAASELRGILPASVFSAG